MKKPGSKKLALARETVRTLQAHDLTHAVGAGKVGSAKTATCVTTAICTSTACGPTLDCPQ